MDFIHPQFLSIVCSFLDDGDNHIKQSLLPLTIKYPFYTEHTDLNGTTTTRCNFYPRKNSKINTLMS